MSLRVRILLAASLLLAVPVAGYRFVLAMESFLRAGQLETAARTAQTLSSALQTGPGSPPRVEAAAGSADADLYVHPLAAAPELDGYPSDWEELAPDAAGALPRLRAGSRDEFLYLVVRWPAAAGASALRLVLEDAPQLRRAWLFDTTRPGPVPVLEVPPARGMTAPGHRDDRFAAAVGHDAGGVVLELRLPLSLLAPRIYLERTGVPADARARLPPAGAFRLVMPAPGLQRALEVFAGVPGRRLRVTDGHGRVLAEAGSLDGASPPGRLALVMERLLDVGDEAPLSLAPGTLALEGPEIAAALAGEPRASLRRGAGEDPLVVLATHPLRGADGIWGVLVLEESTSGIQALARRALLELLAGAGLAFVAGTAWLLLVAGRTAARLRELRDQARRAVAADGRVHAAFRAPAGNDEIGDLGRSFEAAVARLQGYQDYLEQLARRLSHELRTPIAIIRSSLENLSMRPPAGDAPDPLLERARHGVDRLDALIRRMSEATRLEHAMTDTDRTTLDAVELVRRAVAAQAHAWESARLVARCDPAPLWISGSADLLLQALDKLVANAKGFAAPRTTVTVGARALDGCVDVYVENHGQGLPRGPAGRLFDSMVSERAATDDGEPHLGLGLYIVRLVARFHGGQEYAHEIDATDGGMRGVRIGMRLPRAPPAA